MTYALDLGTEVFRYNWQANASFETGTASSWNRVNLKAPTFPTGSAKVGTYEANYQSDATTADACVRSVRVAYNNLGGGRKVRGSIWVKNTAGASRSMRVELWFYDYSGVYRSKITGDLVVVSAAAGWTKLSVAGEFSSFEGEVELRAFPQITNGSTSNYTSFDAGMLETYVGAAPPDFYFDGGYSSEVPAGADDLNIGYEPAAGGTAPNLPSYLYYVTWAQLQNLQNVNVRIGKESDLEVLSPSSGSATLWYPNGFASPVAGLKSRSRVQLRRVGRSVPLWQGRIRDIRVEWNKPYTAGVGNADYVTLELEGHLADHGRTQMEWFAGSQSIAAIGDIAGYPYTIGLTRWVSTPGDVPTITLPNGSGTEADFINNAAQTYNAYVVEGLYRWYVLSQYVNRTATVSFSDTGQSSAVRAMDALTFDSLVDNNVTRVAVNYSAGTVTLNSGVESPSDVSVETFANGYNVAYGLAQDILDKYSEPALSITEIVCLEEAQSTMNLDTLETTAGTWKWAEVIGKEVSVTFRGQTYKRRISGAVFSADPSSARYTYLLAAAASAPYLILGDPVRGILGTNRLAF